MKKFPAIFLGLYTFVGAAYAASGSGVIAEYTFNDGAGNSVHDGAGWGRDGTLNGDARWVGAGKWGSAISFDGAGDYVSIDAEPSGPLTSDYFSVMAWVWLDATPTKVKHIVSKYSTNASEGFRMFVTPAGTLKAEMFSATHHLYNSDPSPLTPGQWNHVGMTFDGRTMRMYVNAVEVGARSNIGQSALANSSMPLIIGSSSTPPTNNNDFNGDIDELRIYDHALTATEIADIYAAINGEPGLLFYEDFEELLANSPVDYTVNGTLLELQPSKFGKSVKLGLAEGFKFPFAGNMETEKGALSFWFKPDWSTSLQSRRFVSTKGGGQRLSLQIQCNSCSTAILAPRGDVDLSDADKAYATNFRLEGELTSLSSNDWHFVEMQWDFSVDKPYVALIVNGAIAHMTDRPAPVSLVGTDPTDILVGRTSADGNYPLEGWIDELKIYSAPTFDRSQTVAQAIDRMRDNGTTEPHETIYNAPTDVEILDPQYQASQDVFFYVTAPFKPVYEGTLPNIAAGFENVVTTASYTTLPDNTESLFFNVYSRIPLDSATVDVGDLVRPGGGKIAAADIDIRVVRNWWQSGKNVGLDYYPNYTPELLLHDHGVNLDGNYSYDSLPSVPKLTYAKDDIEAYTSRQFVMTVTVPDGAAAGVYSGTIALVANSGIYTLPIDLTVEDIDLEAPDKLFMTYYRGVINPVDLPVVNKEDLLPDSDNTDDQSVRYDLQLSNIAEHGMNGAYLFGDKAYYVTKAVEAGLTERLIFGSMSPTQTFNDFSLDIAVAMLDAGLEPYFYPTDEPKNTAELQIAMTRTEIIQNMDFSATAYPQAQARSTLAIFRDEAVCMRAQTCSGVDYTYPYFFDVENIAVDWNDSIGSYMSDLLQGGARDTLNGQTAEQTYYWQSLEEDGRKNRYLAGIHLFLTGLDGVMPYNYQHVRGNPYDDYTPYDPSGDNRPNMLAYPSQQGPIDTIQWEAFREGVDDYRLLLTWQTLYERMATIDASYAQVAYDAVLGGAGLMAPYREGQTYVYANIDHAGFEETRLDLIAAINDLINRDTDGDGIPSFAELDSSNPTDPSRYDTDGDWIGDGFEVNTFGSEPTDPDSDDDGYSDFAEGMAGTDPNEPASQP